MDTESLFIQSMHPHVYNDIIKANSHVLAQVSVLHIKDMDLVAQ